MRISGIVHLVYDTMYAIWELPQILIHLEYNFANGYGISHNGDHSVKSRVFVHWL